MCGDVHLPAGLSRKWPVFTDDLLNQLTQVIWEPNNRFNHNDNYDARIAEQHLILTDLHLTSHTGDFDTPNPLITVIFALIKKSIK